jgi:hydrogenase maturation protease
MSSREVLVAGAGNVFRGDDGFGVAVVARLARRSLPATVKVADFGIRGLHLAYALLDPPELLIVVDAVSRGEAPGTLFVIEPEAGQEGGELGGATDPHGMSLPAVFASVGAMGGTLPRVLIVGCEPAELGETMELSPAVQRAIEPAVELVQDILKRELDVRPSEPRGRGADEDEAEDEAS